MTGLSNFHTHTTFCDGRNTPEEMVLAALDLGCPAIGFSGHSNTPFDPGYSMDARRQAAYRREVLRLQEVFRGKIDIYLGIEQDYFSPPLTEPWDFVIGSVHYVKKGDCYLSLDESRADLEQAAGEFYGGDLYALWEDYYALVADVKNRTHCQIVGHFDLITKFNEGGSFFDESHPRYRAAALGALNRLLSQDALLEINTGAMSRGCRTAPYPAAFLLEEMGRRGAPAIITSDAHRAEDLLFGAEIAAALAKKYCVPLVKSPLLP